MTHPFPPTSARAVITGCIGPLGFKASALRGGYNQVWGRDACITLLGALLLDDAPELRSAARQSLATLGGAQSARGMIPLNVNADNGEVATENSGSLDANSWFILGHWFLHQAEPDSARLEAAWSRLKLAGAWLDHQDYNECGLLEMHEAGDWADLLANRGNALYVNVLYYGALRALARLAETVEPLAVAGYAARAADVRTKINLVLWVRPDRRPEDYPRKEWQFLLHYTGHHRKLPHYLPWVGFRQAGYRFDSFGNFLAILFGVADEEQTRDILDHVVASGADRPGPVRAFWPAVQPGEEEWRTYYHTYGLNLPDQYHNAGVWPFLGGFYVAALVQAGRALEAQAQLEHLRAANQAGAERGLGYNEWLHGGSGQPMGKGQQAWSAAMEIFAGKSVSGGRVPWLATLRV